MLELQDDDVQFEEKLLEDPHDVEMWLLYYQHKLAQPQHSYESLIYILSRALAQLERSYKLWMVYLELKIENYTSVGDVIKSFELALVHLEKFPRFWLLYLSFLKRCDDFDFVKNRYDQALICLPIATHFQIWPSYLEFASQHKNFTIWYRFCLFKTAFYEVEKSVTLEEVLEHLLDYCSAQDVSKLVQTVEKILYTDSLVSQLDSEFDLYWKYLTVLMKFQHSSVDLLIETCINKFPDQKTQLTISCANYYGKLKNDYPKAHLIYTQGISEALTVKEFTSIYEAFLEFEENGISKLMETDDPLLDERMALFEKLMDNRDFYINDIYLKQNSDNVETWLQRIKLFNPKTQVKETLETYVKAIMTINPKKVTKGLYLIWIGYMKVYESNGDLNTARVILSKAVNVPFKDINDLVEIWLEWSNLELRHDDPDQLCKVLENPLTVTDPKIDYNDDELPLQSRVFKSFRLWSFYLDLVESSGDVELTAKVYDQIIALKIAKPITFINYATFYEENKMYEKSLSVFEKALKIFNYPIVYEIWNIYLPKVLEFSKLINIGQERIRDLFDECLDNCPLTNIHPVILLYADFEESNKNISKMFKIYEKSLSKLDPGSKVVIYKLYLSKLSQYRELSHLRPVYEKIINDDDLPLSRDLLQFVKDFISLEAQFEDFDRCRSLLKSFYEFLNESKDAALLNDLEEYWKTFELKFGDENSFKEFLRFKRICQLKFGALEYKAIEGFVRSSEGPKVSSINASAEKEPLLNPDAIELDMDSSDED